MIIKFGSGFKIVLPQPKGLVPESNNPAEELKEKPAPKKDAKNKNEGNRRRKRKSRTSQAKKAARKNRDVPAFRYRNVYKFILRNMRVYAKEALTNLTKFLESKGFCEIEIKTAFEAVMQYKPKEFPSEIIRKPKIKLDEIVKSKSIYAYILKESLDFMIEKLENKGFTQIQDDNLKVYIEACNDYLRRANNILD